MAKMKLIDWIAIILLTVGGLNWGLVAVNFNLVSAIFGSVPIIEKGIYLLVGLSALYTLYWVIFKRK